MDTLPIIFGPVLILAAIFHLVKRYKKKAKKEPEVLVEQGKEPDPYRVISEVACNSEQHPIERLTILITMENREKHRVVIEDTRVEDLTKLDLGIGPEKFEYETGKAIEINYRSAHRYNYPAAREYEEKCITYRTSVYYNRAMAVYEKLRDSVGCAPTVTINLKDGGQLTLNGIKVFSVKLAKKEVAGKITTMHFFTKEIK